MTIRNTLLVPRGAWALASLCLLHAAAAAAESPPSPPAVEEKPLPRYREEGTPYDPTQTLTPFAISSALAGAAESGTIESPVEYAPTKGVLFRYSTAAWPSVVRACVKALTADPTKDEIAYVVVGSQSAATSAATAFASDGADLSKVVFLIKPTDSIWMRDYGPHFVFQDGTLSIVDSHYYPQRQLDNFIPTLLAEDEFGMPSDHIGLYYSGGNFMPGPDRSAFVTALVNLDNPASGGFNPDLIAEFYSRVQGIDTLHVLPQLPGTVDGTGHIDMWMYLVDEDTAIISEFISGSNATAISITNNAVSYMEGLGFEVFRPKAWNAAGNHYTYANAFRVNNRIFVPVYGTSIVPGGNASYNANDAHAIATWQAAAGPGVEIVPIQCSSIISAAGAIHCIVKQVPRYADAVPSAYLRSPTGGEVWLGGTVERIQWNATDTGNAALASVDLLWSPDGGQTWEPIASGLPDSGAFDWQVPEASSASALIQAVVRSVDGDVAVAMSNAFRIGPGVMTVYDFSTGAGVDRFGSGHQTSSWVAGVSGKISPVAVALTSANYLAMASSNAGGGNSDPNRFIAPTISSGQEATHLFRFTIAEDPAEVDEITVLWEGYAERCTQAELYLWDYSSGQWGDGRGFIGQNRFGANFAGNRDGLLRIRLQEALTDVIGPDGTVRALVYAQRPGDRTFHDFLSVTVKQLLECSGDLDGDGSVGGADLGVLLGAWGPCPGCPADLDGDGTVDGADLGLLLTAWGSCS
jgi:agmatine/peptidylarginine deiminase